MRAKWGSWMALKRKYPREFSHFFTMLKRVARSENHPGCLWERTPEGFLEFLSDMGPKPKRGEFVIGRIDHNKPYCAENARWQDKHENARIQNHTGRKKESYQRLGNQSHLIHGRHSKLSLVR